MIPEQVISKQYRGLVENLMKIKIQGIKIRPNTSLLDLWFDADFCEVGNQETAHIYRTIDKARTGLIIIYVGCPMTWA